MIYHKGMHFLKKTCPGTRQITPETPSATSDGTVIVNNKWRRKYKELVRAYFKLYINLLRWIKESHENISMAPVSAVFRDVKLTTVST
jgi:hypothetical protein